jgi:hypothetical protein
MLALKAMIAGLLALLITQYFFNYLISVWAALAVFAIVQVDFSTQWFARVKHLLLATFVWSAVVLLGFLVGQSDLLVVLVLLALSLFCGALATINDAVFNLVLWGLCLFALAAWQPVSLRQSLIVTGVFCFSGLLTLFVCLLLSPKNSRRLLEQQLAWNLSAFRRRLSNSSLDNKVDKPLLSAVQPLAETKGEYLVKALAQSSLLISEINAATLSSELATSLPQAWRSLAGNYLLDMQKPKGGGVVDHQFFYQRLIESRSELAVLREKENQKLSPDFTRYFLLSDQLQRYLLLFAQFKIITVALTEVDCAR